MKADEEIEKMIAEVAKRTQEIGRLENPAYKTNLQIPKVGGGTFNLNTATTMEQLAEQLAGVLILKNSLDEAYKTLGVKSDFRMGGFTYDEWEHDIKKKADRLQLASKKEKLKTLKNRLEKILSPEQKRAMELAAIQKELADD